MKDEPIINNKAKFAVALLQRYAKENLLPARSTSDLGPLEHWLISELYKKMENEVYKGR
jgi:hypothetical protein